MNIDIPAPIYRKLEVQAAQQGLSVHDLVSRGIDRVLLDSVNPNKGRVAFPLIRSKGPKVSLTNEQLYEHIEFDTNVCSRRSGSAISTPK